MSGHSHWHSIKHKKQLEDQKRGKIFSKLARQISVAAKEGSLPEDNHKLRLAIERARSFNLPKDNIERAIKRGTGELEGEAQLEEVLYEAYGPGGIAIIIEGITDNKNRTRGEIKQLLGQYGGKLADAGSVQWLFEKKGVIRIRMRDGYEEPPKREALALAAIEAGAEDIKEGRGEVLEVYTKTQELERVKKALEEKGFKAESATLGWLAKKELELPERERERCQGLFEALDENEAVQEIYSNLKL